MTIAVQQKQEPIPGYTVRERLGAGGYGEVWTADAPGGLKKAIKFVYGYLDEQRASREMKALNRIKEVRHPFLLSLERIEVVEGQLVIVTELADASLKDVYDEFRKSGGKGIPRDKLLLYLGDAADALDYMSESYSLQHLDIKPENLLIVGGRAKVADFGLVKELHDAGVSLMGGLTPLYAPPEVFDGRPSRQSDQYSLAIVFQELLTGTLPFPGTSAAQLATQHLNSPPRLSSLPTADQAVIAKAMAKNPNDRLASCRQLVDLLAQAGRSEGNATVVPLEVNGQQVTASNKDCPTVNRVPGRSVERQFPARVANKAQLPPCVENPAVTNASPLEADSVEVQLQPTVVIGIGGSGGQVLSQLRSRLCERFGSTDSIPAVQMLAIDTDAKALGRLTQGEDYRALDPGDTLALPLRRPQDYRNQTEQILQSISRRWLYNIPRSLQTEGLRPLGRLALLDHGERFIQRLRDAVSAVAETEAIRATQETTGLPVTQHPRIIVVSSISGGCGSGMVLDVAYALRNVLAEFGFPADQTCGILTHSTPRNAAGKDFAAANAFACLNELQHYCRPDKNYPGNAACGLPTFDAATAPFADGYLVHLGDDLNEVQLREGIDRLAEYVYLDVATAGSAMLHACRVSDRTQDGLRTFGLCQIGCSDTETISTAVEVLCQQVIHRWHKLDDGKSKRLASCSIRLPEFPDGEQDLKPSPLHGLCATQSREFGLDFDSLTQTAHQVVEQQLGEDLQNWLRSLLTPFADGVIADGLPAATMEAIDARFGLRAAAADQQVVSTSDFEEALTPRLKERSGTLATSVCNWLWKLLDEPEVRLHGAKIAAAWYIEHLASLPKRSEDVLAQLGRELNEISQVVEQGKRKQRAGSEMRPLLTQYFRLRLHRTAVEQVAKLVKPIESQVKAVDVKLAELGRELRQIAEQFPTPAVGSYPAEDDLAALRHVLRQALHDQVPRLAVQLDREFSAEFFGPHGGLRSLTLNEMDLRQTLPQALRQAARRTLADARRELRIVDALVGQGDESQTQTHLTSCLAAAKPKLLECGGTKRLIIVAPGEEMGRELRPQIEQGFGETVSVVSDSDSDIVFCYEVGGVSLAQVAATIIDNRLDYAEAADKLHARSDIDWAPWPRG